MSRGGFTESNLARCATPSCVTITKQLPSGVNAKHLAAGNVQRTLVSDSCELFDSVFSYSITPQLIIQITHNTRLRALCPGQPRWASTRKVKPIWILLNRETLSGSGISWAICKSAPRSRQITTPASHHSVFTGRMPFLPPNQQRQSTEGKHTHTLVCVSVCAYTNNLTFKLVD